MVFTYFSGMIFGFLSLILVYVRLVYMKRPRHRFYDQNNPYLPSEEDKTSLRVDPWFYYRLFGQKPRTQKTTSKAATSSPQQDDNDPEYGGQQASDGDVLSAMSARNPLFAPQVASSTVHYVAQQSNATSFLPSENVQLSAPYNGESTEQFASKSHTKRKRRRGSKHARKRKKERMKQ